MPQKRAPRLLIATIALLVPAAVEAAQPRFVAGEVLVRPGADRQAELSAALRALGLGILETDVYSGVMCVAVPAGSEEAWIKALASRPDVEYAERNGLGSGGIEPDDTHFGSQWHLRNTGQGGGAPGADIDAVRAWDIATGSPLVVTAVLDTGIDSDHQDFAGRIDPDGWDFVNEDADPEADHPHGTWVSGCLGANANNGFGVAGVDWGCMILPIKVLDGNNFGATFDLAQGLNYCANQADVSIISMSLINYPGNQTLINALQNARDQGKILIACGGNGGIGDADFSYPGASPLTISIGATRDDDSRARFSGTGSALDFVAPGENVVTSAHGTDADITAVVSGCSFATPITAGVAGLLLDRAAALNLTLDQDGIYDLLRQGAEDQVGPPNEDTPGRDDSFGHGRINAHASLLALCVVLDYHKLLSAEVVAGDRFGHSIAMSGGTTLVGAVADQSNGINAGAAYVFRFDDPNWVQEQKLLAADGTGGEQFGHVVALSGQTALVGAVSDDDNGGASGSAYVFRFDGSSWQEEQKLLPVDGEEGDEFGQAVDVAGEIAVIGAVSDDDNGSVSGSAYVYRFNGSSWVEEQKLLPVDGEAGDEFGQAVGVAGEIAVIGAVSDDDNGTNAGAVYVYRFNGSSWVEEQKLLADDGEAGDAFGISLDTSGDTVLIGAFTEDDNGSAAGAAYVFRFNGSSWEQQQKLLASDGEQADVFGWSVALSGETAVIGAYRDDDNGGTSGSAYLFHFDDSSWVETRKLLPLDGAADDRFGYSVAVSGVIPAVGASHDDDQGSSSGGAYIFPEEPPFDCNGNDIVDRCDIDVGRSRDANDNGVPDECECPWDLDGDGLVGIVDLKMLLGAWGTDPGGPPDFDGDMNVATSDLLKLLGLWGPCQ